MMMMRSILRSTSIASSSIAHSPEKVLLPAIGSISSSPTPHLQIFTRHFLDLHKMVNKEAIEKEKARLADEMSRGYFQDISEIRKNGGKIAMANKTLIPSLTASKFPDFEVNLPDGGSLKLPIIPGKYATDTSERVIPSVSLFCLSFRASSQAMASSWSAPFLGAFSPSGKVQVYEVSFIDSWYMSLGPLRQMFLKMMKKSSSPQKQVVYSFGDNYYLRKELQILNLLTGYIFLLDKSGKIRWQGYGWATEEELSHLLSCTSLLLDGDEA
ncbi:uncharacterized protein M6B38_291395 [Iris pallida]|uniref:Mitochondrial ATPase complex subunit ATP10 n=1 Tax=Iris pallida TaxID=29817 RepID=A0AAX6HT12_IRIPA|nr:uncharacterized protein M6B38_291395 [Iris pallida]